MSNVTSRALVPISPSNTLPALSSTTAGSVCVRAGRRRLFSSEMRVEVANNTDAPMMCAFTAWAGQREISLEPAFEWIDAFTTGTITLRVPWSARSVTVRMRGASQEYTASADVPRPKGVALALALPLLGVVALGGAVVSKPAIESLSVPDRLYAGDAARVAYAYRGVGSGRYTVTSGASIIASGSLHDSGGAFSFATGKNAAAYDIAVNVSGPTGAAQEHRTIRTQPLPQPYTPAAISNLSVQPAVAVSGKPFTARYNANAQDGVLKLIDDKGVTWDAQSYRANGSTPFVAPHVEHAQRFRLQLDVRRDATLAQAVTGLLVMPASPSPSPSPANATSMNPPAAVSIVT